MRIKKQSTYNAIAYITIICQALTWIGLPLVIYSLVSLSVAMISLVTVGAVEFLILDRKETVEKNDLILLGGLAALVIFCMMTTATFSFELVKKIIIVFQLPVLMLVARRTQGGRARDVIYIANACYPALFLYYYNSPLAHSYMGPYGEIQIEAITLGFNNPNETAMYLMACALLLMAAMFHYKSPFIRFFYGVELLFMLRLIYETECRSVILLMAAIMIIVFFRRKFSVSKSVIRLAFLLPIGFFLINWGFPEIGNIVIMGEAADTGRTTIMYSFFEGLTMESFILGDFGRYPLNNMHNAFLSLLAAFGVLSALAYWGFYYRGFLMICNRKMKSLEGKVLQLGCVAIVLHGSVEAAFLTSGVIYAASVFLLLFMLAGIEE